MKIYDNHGKQCPICERGVLRTSDMEQWDCNRRRCNSQFFLEGPEGQRELNVRDIRKRTHWDRILFGW